MRKFYASDGLVEYIEKKKKVRKMEINRVKRPEKKKND